MPYNKQQPTDLDTTNEAGIMKRLADFIFEVGMLRKTPRSGYQFLGSGAENVAEHSYRVTVIGVILSRMAGANTAQTVMLCLFHDLHEARTGDFNYVNSIYNSCNEQKALEDATKGTGLEELILPLWDELEKKNSQESLLAHDADQLDLIFNLLQEKALGNNYAEKWLISAVARLKTSQAKTLAAYAAETDPMDWWFTDPTDQWWVNKNNK